MSLTLNNVGREVAYLGLGEIPEIGVLFEGLIALFWPESPEDIWEEIKEKVEDYVEEQMNDQEFGNAVNDLVGMTNDLEDYKGILAIFRKDPIGTKLDMHSKWFDIHSGFNKYIPKFGDYGNGQYSVLLLPLYVQLANLHLLHLLDAVHFGKDFGMEKNVVQMMLKEVEKHSHTEDTTSYLLHVQNTYKKGISDFLEKHPKPYNRDIAEAQQTFYEQHNAYTFKMKTEVLGITYLWPYYVPGSTRPIPPQTEEIFTPPFGALMPKDGDLHIKTQHDGRLTGVRLFNDAQFCGYQVQYDNGKWGPEKGDFKYAERPPKVEATAEYMLPFNGYKISCGDVIDSLTLCTATNGTTKVVGNPSKKVNEEAFLPDHILSSIQTAGDNRQIYYSPEMITLGFRWADSYGITIDDLNIKKDATFKIRSFATTKSGHKLYLNMNLDGSVTVTTKPMVWTTYSVKGAGVGSFNLLFANGRFLYLSDHNINEKAKSVGGLRPYNFPNKVSDKAIHMSWYTIDAGAPQEFFIQSKFNEAFYLNVKGAEPYLSGGEVIAWKRAEKQDNLLWAYDDFHIHMGQ